MIARRRQMSAARPVALCFVGGGLARDRFGGRVVERGRKILAAGIPAREIGGRGAPALRLGIHWRGGADQGSARNHWSYIHTG
jgi:hypothetical protein